MAIPFRMPTISVRAEVAPDLPILSGDRQAAELARQDERKRGREVREEVGERLVLEPEPERRVVGQREEREIEHDLEGAVLIGDVGDERRRRTIGFDVVRFDVAEDDADAGEKNEIEGDEERGVADVGVLQAQRDEASERGQQVEAEHGLPLVNPKGNQAMRQMIAPAEKRAAPREAAGDAHERGVENRHEQDEERDCRHRHHAGLQSGRRQKRCAGEERPEEQTAAVAHEDRRGSRVVDEKAERRANQRGDRHRQRGRTTGREGGQEEHTGNRGDAGRQTVDVVEQVEGVGDADDPHEREQRIDGRAAGDVCRRHQKHDDGGDDGLRDELGRGAEVREVVERPEHEHQPGADEQRQQRLQRRTEERGAEEGRDNRVAPQNRDGLGMPAVALRLSQEAALAGQPSYEWRQRCREREAPEKRQQSGRHVHELRRSADVRDTPRLPFAALREYTKHRMKPTQKGRWTFSRRYTTGTYRRHRQQGNADHGAHRHGRRRLVGNG